MAADDHAYQDTGKQRKRDNDKAAGLKGPEQEIDFNNGHVLQDKKQKHSPTYHSQIMF